MGWRANRHLVALTHWTHRDLYPVICRALWIADGDCRQVGDMARHRIWLEVGPVSWWSGLWMKQVIVITDVAIAMAFLGIATEFLQSDPAVHCALLTSLV